MADRKVVQKSIYLSKIRAADLRLQQGGRQADPSNALCHHKCTALSKALGSSAQSTPGDIGSDDRRLKSILAEEDEPGRSEKPSNSRPRGQDPESRGVTSTVKGKSAQCKVVVLGARNFQMPGASNFVISA